MPLLIRTPRVPSVLREFGAYPSGLNMLDRKETAVQRQLRRAGLAGYEPQTQATLLTLVQLSERPVEFFDVGAHIGLYSALVSAIFPPDVVHVTAFEPTPATATIAQHVAEHNRLSFQLERIALSDSDGHAELYISDKAETSNSLVAGFRSSSEAVKVRTVTLDSYCQSKGVVPTLMKIDVETFEAHVVRGALRTLRERRPTVVCELLPPRSSNAASPGDEHAAYVVSVFDELGYVANRWDGEGWQATPADKVADHLDGAIRDWLFTPEPLSEAFAPALGEWLDAIAQCTEGHNLLIAGGTKPPLGWNRAYRWAEPWVNP